MRYRCPRCGACYEPVRRATVELMDGTRRRTETNHDAAYRHAVYECPHRREMGEAGRSLSRSTVRPLHETSGEV